MSSLDLKKFDMRSIVFDPKESKGPVIVLLGRRETGKSFLVRDLLFHHRDIPIGTVMSGTEMVNKFYSEIVPQLFIHHEYSSNVMENVIRRQLTIMKQYQKELEATKRSQIDPRAFLILDDCLYDEKWTRDKLIRMVFLNGRHCRLMFLVCLQYPLGIPPLLRSNVDYVFILRENVMANRKRIYDNYASMFPTFELFCNIMDQTTENYECLVINNNAKSNKLEDQIFWYKAQPHSNFRLGSKEFWEISKNINNDEENSMLTGNKKAGQVKVNKNNW